MKILIDMNIPPRYAALLNFRNITSVHWTDVGAPDASDAHIIDYALINGYVILTSDMDFNTIIATTHNLKPSVVLIRASIQHIERSVESLATALVQYSNELSKGAIMSVDTKNARIRLLPI